MTIFVELFDGSYDLLLLSLYISLLMTVAIDTIWGHMVKKPSQNLVSRNLIAEKKQAEVKERLHMLSPVNEMIQWLQRTVRRKDDTGDEDHYLLYICR
ncbi:hypothetical protein [Halobacillus massiliensis]|uniref:hypothetical protein n=1 Tax=Halobacillus massiliensis TaxID=1926286 RepID=UPI0009E45584|nr:hypothetical protein [Halobacillus massiliensis]